MPEGPEVRLTVDFLSKKLQGNIITNWMFCGGRYADNFPEFYQTFDSNLPMYVKSVKCKGKFIYFILQNSSGKEFYILHSLMLTGRWQNVHDDYCKWYVEYKDGDKTYTIWFRDVRSFATIEFTDNIDVLKTKLTNLGPDILSRDFTLDVFIKQISNKPLTNICSFLMDQSNISGCGNYIKAEVLYESNISPLRKVESLTEDEIESLYNSLRIISRLSYNNKGVSLKDYTNENGDKGYYHIKLKVYGNKDMKTTKTADGRTTYWDPKTQK